jgi:hypothetical protein
MYRLAIVSVIFLALACKGETKSASAATAKSNTSQPSAQAAASQTSNTAGDLAGPTSTTQGPNASYAANTTSGTSNAVGGSATSNAAPGTPNPNRIPNEMGRIMVLEYHLITDHNGDYARERGRSSEGIVASGVRVR